MASEKVRLWITFLFFAVVVGTIAALAPASRVLVLAAHRGHGISSRASDVKARVSPHMLLEFGWLAVFITTRMRCGNAQTTTASFGSSWLLSLLSRDGKHKGFPDYPKLSGPATPAFPRISLDQILTPTNQNSQAATKCSGSYRNSIPPELVPAFGEAPGNGTTQKEKECWRP